MSIHLSDDALIAAAGQYGTPVYVYHGEKIAEGVPEAVVRDPAVLECYLGEAEL